MTKYCVKKWDKNREVLRNYIKEHLNEFDGYDYIDLVKVIIEIIFDNEWDKNNITEIDNGDYQGTLLFMIPAPLYQPSVDDYLLTYVAYGSCCCCDTLQSVQYEDDKEQKIKDYMTLCKDIVTNIIKPYNHGWRHDENFDIIEEM